MDTELLWYRVKESELWTRGTKYRLPLFLTLAIVLLGTITFVVCRSFVSPTVITHQENSILNTEVIASTDTNVVDDYNKTYAIRYAIKRQMRSTNFTCMVQNAQDSCPVYMEVFNKLFRVEIVYFISGERHLISDYGSIQLTLENDTVTFKMREKLCYFVFGGFRKFGPIVNETDESVSGSVDFNWDRKIEFNSSDSITATVIDSNYSCSNSNWEENGYLISCPQSEPIAKQFTNWIRAVFGLESMNATWTAGKALNWPSITSELSIVGRIQEGWSRQDVQRNIILFDKQQKKWCDCMKPLSKRFIQKGDNRCFCFQKLATRMDFQMQFDYKICEREAIHEEEDSYPNWI